MKATTQINLFSRISIFLSSLCVIHCLAVPFLILFLPALSFFTGSTFESILILTVVPLSAAGFFPTWLRHKNRTYLTVYVSSILLLLIGQFAVSHNHHVTLAQTASLGYFSEIILLTVGALGLAWVTYKNAKHTHSCTNPHHKH
ncbi:MerC mercury resistance protein [Cyclonatronum proteinivorum]|uniref:MerC mercury resistance protein n=1 Tax=Cyclonatronum proteinivorum TaxID=1457365 RepID=A0A345UKN5_9BACT|nr:MerC domain-containing protein [Cyclonatronum proteinivorum]AXJ01037.1 MerC mercury resistance protein [Cyclonatronum proteinivorum]